MDGRTLEINQRYLLRIDRKQVPVIYQGKRRWDSESKDHTFSRIDNGEWIYKRHARAVSRHFDSCQRKFDSNGVVQGSCDCRAKLEALR